MSPPTQIFVSHSHEDDPFCLRLVADLRAHFGDDAVWYDTSGGLHGGESWVDRIVTEITERPNFLVVLSPAAVNSKWVVQEMAMAFRQHVELGKRLFPVRLAAAPRRPEWAGIQEFDFQSHHDSARYKHALTELVHALNADSSRLVPPTSTTSDRQDVPYRPRIVDATGGGDHTNLADAIRASTPGERVLVFPGRYVGVLHIDRPLEIIGVGPTDQIVIEGTRADLIDFQAQWSRIANLTVRQLGSGDLSAAFGIHGGSLQIEGCNITSGNYGLYLYTNAAVYMSGCHVQNCGNNAIYLTRKGEATLEENTIVGGRSDAVVIWGGSSATLRSNLINDNAGAAIRMSARSVCRAENNDLRGNARSWDIPSGGWDRVHHVRNQES